MMKTTLLASLLLSVAFASASPTFAAQGPIYDPQSPPIIVIPSDTPPDDPGDTPSNPGGRDDTPPPGGDTPPPGGDIPPPGGDIPPPGGDTPPPDGGNPGDDPPPPGDGTVPGGDKPFSSKADDGADWKMALACEVQEDGKVVFYNKGDTAIPKGARLKWRVADLGGFLGLLQQFEPGEQATAPELLDASMDGRLCEAKAL